MFKLFTFAIVWTVAAAASEPALRDQLRTLTRQIDLLKADHLTEITALKRDIEDLKEKVAHQPATAELNEQATLQWAKTSLEEVRTEIREVTASVNNSVLLKQLHAIRNQLKQCLTESADLAQLARTQEARINKLDREGGRTKYEWQELRAAMADVRAQVAKHNKEVKAKQLSAEEMYNNVGDEPAHAHRTRHNKMVHAQISRLARSQDQLDASQQNLQTQILDVQRRLDRFGDMNWDLLAAKVDYLEIEDKVLRERLQNTTQRLSDLDKVHASMLELREDLESVENKADRTAPEFRKEISKLDVSFAQLTAQSSYLKEDQENLRQSVKAIAVSVSNSMDRADQDRRIVDKLNDSVAELQSAAKQHFYRLNDHILKSEANPVDANDTVTIPLPELIGEVKQLEPVQREYQDLVNQLPRDCSAIAAPGPYLIHPGHAPLDTWCANYTTLLQRRLNGSIEFNRPFAEYVKGFGEPAAEYWLGLEAMHQLTRDNCSSMRINLVDIYGGSWYAQYDHFSVGDAAAGFVLNVAGFSGNASDAFEYQNHMEFSAIDRDRDISNTHCAGNYEGGWWYSHCQHVNINGKYTLGLTWFDADRNEWIAVATSEMTLSRRRDC